MNINENTVLPGFIAWLICSCNLGLIYFFETFDKVGDYFESTGRLKTHNNRKYIRYTWEVNSENNNWLPLHNGGDYRQFFGNELFVVDYSRKAVKNYESHGGMVGKNYAKLGVTWNLITSANPGFRLKEPKVPNSSGSPTVIARSNRIDDVLNLLGFLNSKVCSFILNIINPTINTNVSNIMSLPYVPTSITSSKLAKNNVEITSDDWNSFETSWDFTTHPLLTHIADDKRNEVNGELKNAFSLWQDEAQNRFDQLKSNEEELNRSFIDLYGLNDELTPEVADKDVSVRLADEERDIKSFLSYFVGVVFGRYSLDAEGLAFAGGEWDRSKYQSLVPNEDNLLMLNDADYFGDSRDIIYRFKEFLTATFGPGTVEENIAYIASVIGKKADSDEAAIRRYFVEDFFKDHKKIYQKRPIYWEYSSGKNNGFKALMYLHRYDSDELAMIRTNYLHPLQGKYELRIDQLTQLASNETVASQKKRYEKELKHLNQQLAEIIKYDPLIQHIANQKIELDLDDGVVVNYDKLQDGSTILSKLK